MADMYIDPQASIEIVTLTSKKQASLFSHAYQRHKCFIIGTKYKYFDKLVVLLNYLIDFYLRDACLRNLHMHHGQ